MYSRWSNVTVVLFWLATMSWLVGAKVLPLLLSIGEPPSLPEIVESQLNDPPVGWDILIDNKRRGWALMEVKLRDAGIRDLRGRVYFDKLSLGEMVPGWLQPLSQLAGKHVDELQIDARSVLSVDALGHLLCFESTVRLNPPDEVVGMSGIVEGGQLHLVVRASGISISKEFPLPSNALPSDLLSPQPQLPGLHAGQSWSVPVYSPFWPAKNPLKIIHATVEGPEPLSYDGAMENVWLVVYRSDTGNASDGGRNRRGKAWVRRDGTVLRQQALLFNSTVTFVRLTERQAAKLVKSAGKEWWTPESGAWVDSHD